MPHGFWGCHFAKGGAVIPREFYSWVPNSAGCHILCDTGASATLLRQDTWERVNVPPVRKELTPCPEHRSVLMVHPCRSMDGPQLVLTLQERDLSSR